MTCVRRLPNLTGCALAAALALMPVSGMAQTPDLDSSVDLLQPSLNGNPVNPPRFRRPGIAPATAQADEAPPTGTFTATSRIGATPVYGSPSASGAADTGFDSANTPRRKKRPRTLVPAGRQPETTFTPPITPAPPRIVRLPLRRTLPAAEIHPAKAASRTGATLPPLPQPAPLSNPPPEVHPASAATRPGAALPIPATLDVDAFAGTPPLTGPPPNTLPMGVLPQRPLPIAAGDPYAPLGIRAGSFVLLPSLDLSGNYSTNPERVSGGSGSPYAIAAPELQVASDWARHSLTADIAASYTQYTQKLVPSLNVPALNSKIDGRVDVLRDTHIILENRVIVATDNPGSPNLQAGLAKLPINTDVGGTVGVVQEFNRLSITAKGSFDRAVYQNSLLTDGESVSNADRNLNETAAILRAGYDLDPGLKPFIEVQEDERIHDEPFDRSALQRDSVGTSVKAGGAVDLFGSLTGEMSGGWVVRNYKDPTLATVSGMTADGSLIWQATELTTAKLVASTEVYETIFAAASAELTRDVSLQVDHALQRWLILTLKGGFGTDNYVGSALRDKRYFVSGGVTYKISQELWLRSEVRQDWQTATEAGFAYNATSFLVGLRLQR